MHLNFEHLLKNMAKKENNTKLEITICDIKGINSINIESLIRIIRGQQVMLDSDLAMLYGVETKRLNEQVKRNLMLRGIWRNPQTQ